MVSSSMTDTIITQPDLKETLFQLLADGWYLFPVGKDKKPLINHWDTGATRTQLGVSEFIKANPGCNWAGYFPGQLIIDIDFRHGGSLEALEAKFGKLPKTRSHQTGDGLHIIFKQPEGYDIRNTTGMAGIPGIDRRGNGGYIVLPPSIHENGNQYKVLDDSPVAGAPLALLEVSSRDKNINKPEVIMSADIPEGQRNDTLFKLACSMRGQGLLQSVIETSLLAANCTQCKPPLPEDEVLKIAKSGSRYYPNSKPNDNNKTTGIFDENVVNVHNFEAQTNQADYHLTDLGNAKRLIDRHGSDLRYCYEKNLWLLWNSRYWEWVNAGKIIALASETILHLYHEVAQTAGKEHNELLSHAKLSESEQRLKAMVALAQTLEGVPVRIADLDKDQLLFNCNNGTIDLQTGNLLKHNRSNYITKICPVDYDPNAKSRLWSLFLDKIMDGNQGLINYLQRAVGYSLTGSTKEQVLFFLYGGGCNGKSTFCNVIRILLADYGIQASTEIFLASDRSSRNIDESLARLQGVRIAIATETEEGRRLSVAQVKAMTGGEPITAAPKYQHEQQFEATHKIWLSGNHKPKITDTTQAIWRRMRLIPFIVTIAENERDPDLLVKLQAELPGILAWAVRGCLEWQEARLGEPDEIKNATQGYRDEEDSLREFIIDKCKLEPKASIEKNKLWTAYISWCTANREQELNRREFSNRLVEKGMISKKGTAGVRLWEGIRLLEAKETESDDQPVAQVAPVADFSQKSHIEKIKEKCVKTTPITPLTPLMVNDDLLEEPNF